MDTALVRAVAHPGIKLPPWPDLTEPRSDLVPSWVTWLRQVWAIGAVAEAVALSSPVLAQQVGRLCAGEPCSVREARRTVLATARYAQRMLGRPTPFGLLAGVAPAVFGSRAPTRWSSSHRAVARAGAAWLTDVIAHLEGCPDLLSRLPVVANSTMMVRDDRLIVPYQQQPGPDGQLGAVEESRGTTTGPGPRRRPGGRLALLGSGPATGPGR
ncbi:lantibiotic dehydratase [Micromonospora gifhornensis]|uniref:lantibiotic dehydratase n=1 Tax=Micromonospora gifhornensis TaxID=84594 RepID=UPI003570E8ED